MGSRLNGRFLTALTALLLGLGLGAWGMRLAYDRSVRQWDPRQLVVAQLSSELDLNLAQQDQVAAILAGQKALLEVRRRAWEEDVNVFGRQGEDAIDGILDQRQAVLFGAERDRIHGNVERYLWASDAPTDAVAGEGR